MININNDIVVSLLERFYIIHEKINHRVILIRLGTMDDPTSMEELKNISRLNNQFLVEQKEIIKMI